MTFWSDSGGETRRQVWFVPHGDALARHGWYAKYRLPDGRQVQKKIGPAWGEHGRPSAGYFTKRLAEDWLREVMDQVRRGTLTGLVRTGATFSDAAAGWLRYIEHDRGRKPLGYRVVELVNPSREAAAVRP